MSTSSLDPSFWEIPSSSHSPIEDPSRNGTGEFHSENETMSATRRVQRENSGSNNKRSSSSSPCKKSGLMSDLVRNQLFTSPTKRRRRYRRRNSIYIRKENMEQWTNMMLHSLGEKGKKDDEDEDHQSLPDLFSSNHSIGDIVNEGAAQGSSTAERTSSNAKVFKEFHTSWSNPQDTQSFMEFSMLSLDGNDDESEELRRCCTEPVNKVASNEDSITSFTASGSDWTTGSSSYMDIR